jgi:AhpD family alkylhydroperoxidase
MPTVPDDLLGAAQAELADGLVPWPDDFMDSLSPPAALLFARQVTMKTLQMATGAAASLAEGPDEPQSVVSAVLNGCAMAVAGTTHALVALGLLPKEAEEALGSPSAPRG